MDNESARRASAAAWDDVGRQFKFLGQQLATHYREQAPGESAAGESAADRDAVDKAVRSIADAVEQAVDSVGAAVRDPDVRDQAKRAAQSVVDAIGTTVTEFGKDISEYAPRYKPTQEGSAESTSTASDAADPDAVWDSPPPKPDEPKPDDF